MAAAAMAGVAAAVPAAAVPAATGGRMAARVARAARPEAEAV